MKLSIIIPLYNETENLKPLFVELKEALSQFDYEIIAVDDGSTDGTGEELLKIASAEHKIKAVLFRRNFGQTAALSCGISQASGDIIVPIDSDLENDPHDIPRLLKKIDEGYDVVSGWRKDRWHGKTFSRIIPSVAANWLISKITGLHLHDYGCTLKAYRRDVVSDIFLYGEMHRFIPAYAFWSGAKVTEISVNFRPRRFGTSKYGFSRVFKVLVDLVFIKFLHKYFDKPIHFFGGLGGISFSIGVLTGVLAVALKILRIRDFVETPLPVFSSLFIMVGVQLLAMGIIAEILMRTYYESQDKKPYIIKQKINFD